MANNIAMRYAPFNMLAKDILLDLERLEHNLRREFLCIETGELETNSPELKRAVERRAKFHLAMQRVQAATAELKK